MPNINGVVIKVVLKTRHRYIYVNATDNNHVGNMVQLIIAKNACG